ncbi:DnaD domain protein, partial [Listeria monocytogenes]|nr:DnaD domain protein [Listeria monocytogenes]EAH2240461.1 DnaD domain protein [Listeria monocytogenes]EAH3326825.1 DnaD domain protein [Listeria monocytogenes]
QQEAPKQQKLTEEEREAMERQVAEIKAQLAARNEAHT